MFNPQRFVLFISPIFITIILIVTPTDLSAAERDSSLFVAPAHKITIKNSVVPPSWMDLWEEARNSVRNGDLVLAEKRYGQLFLEKPDIEESLREYALVLMDLEKWENAAPLLRRLLEKNPDSLEYQMMGGRIYMHLKQYRQAATYFGQVYTVDPEGKDALEALHGQVVSLQELGRKDLAYTLMEQLYLLEPHEEEAIRRLAEYSIELGFMNKAKMYYKTLLTEFNPTEHDFFNGEPFFTDDPDPAMAVLCWYGYLKSHPDNILFRRKLADHFLHGENKIEALPHLLNLIENDTTDDNLYLQVGRLYLYGMGRPDKALNYLDEYRKRNPDDKKLALEIERVQAILANDLMVIVENEGAWNLWRDLAMVIPDRLAVYYAMAERLEELGKTKELREVLEIVNFHDPANQQVLFRLAKICYEQKDYNAGLKALNRLDKEQRQGVEYFLLRGRLAEKLGELNSALGHFRSCLMNAGCDRRLVLDCIKIAGTIGDMGELEYFYSLAADEPEVAASGELLYADMLVKNGMYTGAGEIYRKIADGASAGSAPWTMAHEHIVKILQYERKYFAAEQELRILLRQSGGDVRYIKDLVHNALFEREWNRAWKWHNYNVRHSPGKEKEMVVEELLILSAQGKIARAVEMAEDYNDIYPGEEYLQRILARLYFQKGDYYSASGILFSSLKSSSDDLLLRNLVEDKLLDSDKKKQKKEWDANLLEHAEEYKELGAWKDAVDAVKRYMKKYPSSARARVSNAEFLYSAGETYSSLALFEKLSEDYPGEDYFQERVLDLYFETGRFENVIAELGPVLYVETDKKELTYRKEILAEIKTLSSRRKLLLARSLWAVRKNDDALRVYELILDPPVDQVFSRELEKTGIVLNLPPVKRSFWNRITFTIPAEPDRLTHVMSPEFTMENLDSDVVGIASRLYSDYRWQRLVEEEVDVRQDMNDGNYYRAMNSYQKMLNREPTMESLFDLAGIYSRLGFLGKEARLYEIIRGHSPGYPYLDEVMERNSLKRMPNVSMYYGHHAKDGRDGYFDNLEQTVGGQFWMMPSLKHQVKVDYGRIYNESIDKQQNIWRNRFKAEMQWSPLYDLDFVMGMGADRRDETYDTEFLYDFKVSGRLGDTVESFLSASQDVVSDTISSLEGGITGSSYGAGLSLDFLPKLMGGGQYVYTEYSDGNYQNKYGFWGSYVLIPEPNLFQVRYDYSISHNGRENTPGEEGDYPYWSPKGYWQNLFTVSFERQLSENVLGRGAPSYYTLEYALGYEEGGYDNHQFRAKIFLEMSNHFLLNSTFDFIHGSEFDEHDFFMSIIYRW